MIKRCALIIVTLIVIPGLCYWFYHAGILDTQLEAPSSSPYVKPVAENWPQDQRERLTAQQEHIADHQLAFDHFANFAVSQTHGIPLIILKLMPVLAPEYWGDNSNFLSVVGLFIDERNTGYPFARGIGFSGLSRKERFGDVDYASFTCGGCHIGRVKLDYKRFEDSEYYYIDGGINAEFDIIAYRRLVYRTIEKISAGATDPQEKLQRVTNAILAALEQIQQQNPNYFYNNYSYRGRDFDAEYEAQQIALFKASAVSLTSDFIKHQQAVHEGWEMIVDRLYPDAKSLMLQGTPGMEDAIGFSAAKTYLAMKENLLTRLFAPIVLPSAPAITDIMSVWEQQARNPHWNEDNTKLVNGGGQWNGHIPLPIYKNIGGQTTTGFPNVDITVSAFAEQLLENFPATVYPFDVDVSLAQKGQLLFAKHCASCHQPNNGKVYRSIGTDPGRAEMAGTLVTIGARLSFGDDDLCSATTTIEMNGVAVQPCAQYRGVSLKGKTQAIMASPMNHDGYNALPLIGVWARAPYFHNGSVPTLYHLLVPSERPDVFIKSRLDYDTELLGFSWDPDKPPSSTRHKGYMFDTKTSVGISNKGHDTDIVNGDSVYKLNWEDDKPGAMAIIEYLKTL